MQPERNVRYTYADYCAWPEDERRELIEGVPYALASPSRAHQEVLMEISRQIANYLVGKTCEVYPSDFDVILADDTVVVPDISVICDDDFQL